MIEKCETCFFLECMAGFGSFCPVKGITIEDLNYSCDDYEVNSFDMKKEMIEIKKAKRSEIIAKIKELQKELKELN